MKTNQLKKVLVPMGFTTAAILFAAIGNSANKSKALMDVQGYQFVSAADPCHYRKLCSNLHGPICKYGTAQLWGKEDESDLTCVAVVYERQ